MIPDCTALILAGGDSRRMGRDKTRIEFDGQPLLQRVIGQMKVLFPQVLVSVRQARVGIDVPQICDEIPGAGPLAGLCAGLGHAETPWVFAVAADMPFLNPGLIGQLAKKRNSSQAVVPVVKGYPQPLTAFYARSALPVIQAVLAGSGKHSLRSVLERLDVLWVDEKNLIGADPGLRSFVDLDTPDDLLRARGNEKEQFIE